MINLVIVNGHPRSGKDTFIDYIVDNSVFDNTHRVSHSTIDTPKTIAMIMGWDGEKTPEIRLQLSNLKDFLTKKFDLPFKEILNLVEETEYWHDADSFIFVQVNYLSLY